MAARCISSGKQVSHELRALRGTGDLGARQADIVSMPSGCKASRLMRSSSSSCRINVERAKSTDRDIAWVSDEYIGVHDVRGRAGREDEDKVRERRDTAGTVLAKRLAEETE